MNLTAATVPGAAEGGPSSPLTGQTSVRNGNGRPSSLIYERPLGFCDLDGVLWLPKKRRHAVCGTMLNGYEGREDFPAFPGINTLLAAHLKNPIATVGADEFWRRCREHGDIATVVLDGIPEAEIQHYEFVTDCIRFQYEKVLAMYLPEHMELDDFPDAHVEPVKRALTLVKTHLVTFRSFPDRQLAHFVRKGLIRPGEGMFKAKDVLVVGGGHKAAQAKADAILRYFRDVIEAHRRIGLYPMLKGDALSDLEVALLVGCWFVGFHETGEASFDRMEEKIRKEAKLRGVERSQMPVTLFESVADPKYLDYLDWISKKWKRRVAEYRAFVARPSEE